MTKTIIRPEHTHAVVYVGNSWGHRERGYVTQLHCSEAAAFDHLPRGGYHIIVPLDEASRRYPKTARVYFRAAR